MDKKQISAERKQMIVKSNDIIQKSRYKLSTQQQKLILYMVSKIRPDDKEFKEYIFDLRDLCQILNIDINSANYNRFRESMQKIADSSFWIRNNGADKLYRWIDDIDIIPNDTIVKIKFDKDLKPFLLQLKESFTVYQLENVLCFTCRYSFILYELLHSYGFIGEFEISVEELKSKLMIENKYDRFVIFRTKVLDKAIEEINKYTDLKVAYSFIKSKRSVIGIKFEMYSSYISEKINQENRNNRLSNDKKEF